MVISVNDYKQIRQRYLNGESQRSIAKSMGISRNTVKKYCEPLCFINHSKNIAGSAD